MLASRIRIRLDSVSRPVYDSSVHQFGETGDKGVPWFSRVREKVGNIQLSAHCTFRVNNIIGI